MNVDIRPIKYVISQYLRILRGYGPLKYTKSYEGAKTTVDKLKQTIIDLGNNPNMSGTYVCPWKRLGQKVNRKKTGPQYPYLRMYDYKYAPNAAWHIVYVVDEPNNTIRFTKLYGNGYNTGKRLIYPNGKPILECLRWMLRLGCMDESQVETAMQHWLL